VGDGDFTAAAVSPAVPGQPSAPTGVAIALSVVAAGQIPDITLTYTRTPTPAKLFVFIETGKIRVACTPDLKP